VARRTAFSLSPSFRVASITAGKAPRGPQSSRAPRRHVCYELFFFAAAF
jgi:hypothetical protein